MILSDFAGQYMCFHIHPAITFDEDEGSPYIALRTDYYYQLEYEYSDVYYGEVDSGEFNYSGHISDRYGPHSFAAVNSPQNGLSVVWSDCNDIYLWREILSEVSDEVVSTLPVQTKLFWAYPNPFNSSTRISYSLPSPQQVRLEIFNHLGQKVATLVEEQQSAGMKEILWDGSEVSSGLYFYRLTAGQFSETRKMMFLK